jgi:hypothetical protein
MIKVKRVGTPGSLEFETIVRDADGETRHRVTMARETYERLTGGKFSPEQCVEAAFAFLLEREPKESILHRFDLTMIPRYFSAFDGEFPRYLQQIGTSDKHS